MLNRLSLWKVALLGIGAATLVIAVLAAVIWFTVARERIVAPTPPVVAAVTPGVTATPLLTATIEPTSTPIPPDAALGVVQDYTPGALIIVITPIQGMVEQIIVPQNLQVSWEDGRRASPRDIMRGQTIYAEGSLDALGRLIAASLVIIDPGAAVTATPPPVTPTPTVTPTPAIPRQAWLGEYYANMNLSGAPVLVRQDAALDFRWSAGSPGPTVPADRFSARWRGFWRFESGLYNLAAHSDDGVRIWVGGQLVVDRWLDQSGGLATGQIYLQSGDHLVEIEYYENSGEAEMRLRWERQGAFANWKGEYFANTRLEGEPALVRNDEEISFNWGGGAPHPQVPADNFGARWTQDIAFEEGAHRFRARADDGVRVWVAGVLIIDAWQAAVDQTFTGYIWLPQGSHPVRIEYLEMGGNASIQVWRERITTFTNWRGEYFANPDLAGAPRFVRDDERIAFDWGQRSPGFGLPDDGFSARWVRVVPLDAGRYNFWAMADDGVRVYVNGRLLIDAWRDGAAQRFDGTIDLAQGEHRIVVEYYERVGQALVQFGWEWVPPTPTPTLTPTATLTPPPTPTLTPTLTPTPTQTPTPTTP